MLGKVSAWVGFHVIFTHCDLLCSPFLIRMKSLALLYFNPLLNGAFVCVKSAVVLLLCIQLFIQCIFQSPILHIWPCKSKPYSGMSSTKNNQFACIKRRLYVRAVVVQPTTTFDYYHFWSYDANSRVLCDQIYFQNKTDFVFMNTMYESITIIRSHF